MRCFVRKVRLRELTHHDPEATVLIPCGAHDEECFEKWRFDVDLRADIVQPRNIKLHRKAFALLNVVFPHTNYPTVDRLRAAMTIGAGFVDETIDPYTGEAVWYPKSWSFESMDDLEFQELYSRLIDVALKIVPDSKREDWEEAVDQIVRF
jgi:hypothetical protein